MDLGLVGFSHKSAPLEAREALARLGAERVLRALQEEGCVEAVVVSTCNRFEVYSAACGAERVTALLERETARPLREHRYAASRGEAVRHLFRVASGLDSLVVGETEVLGQVKDAYERAKFSGMTSKSFNVLFQRALYLGKLVRTETGIAAGQTSVASVAVQLAESIFGSLRQREVMLLGAGQVAESTARHLLSRKVARVRIANRTHQRAVELALRLGGERAVAQAISWSEVQEALDSADVVIGSTGSPEPVVTRQAVAQAMGRRSGRSLFLIDIAMPRDVDEAVHGLENVYLYRLQDLEGIVAESLKSRAGEVEKAGALAASKAAEFIAWADSLAEGREISLRHSGATA